MDQILEARRNAKKLDRNAKCLRYVCNRQSAKEVSLGAEGGRRGGGEALECEMHRARAGLETKSARRGAKKMGRRGAGGRGRTGARQRTKQRTRHAV